MGKLETVPQMLYYNFHRDKYDNNFSETISNRQRIELDDLVGLFQSYDSMIWKIMLIVLFHFMRLNCIENF